MQFIKDGTPELGPAYLEPTEFFDFDVAAVRRFAHNVIADAEGATDKAVKLYYAVRDSIRYDPYRISLARKTFTASNLLAAKAGATFISPFVGRLDDMVIDADQDHVLGLHIFLQSGRCTTRRGRCWDLSPPPTLA